MATILAAQEMVTTRVKNGKSAALWRVKFRKIAAKLGKVVKLAVNKMTTSHIPFKPNAWVCEGWRPMHKNATIVEGIWGGAEKMQKWRFEPSKKTLPLLGI